MYMSSTESTDQQTVCNLLAQRHRFLSLLTPPPRYTPISPYPTYTKPQLDMRRKIEILQYKKNSTQTNQPTKSQSWAQLANAKTNSAVVCSKNPYTPTSTTACDVPGPPIELSYDPTVPLYNYQTGQDVYANFVESTVIPWSFVMAAEDISSGVVVTTANETMLGTLLIREINEHQSAFQFTIPIGLYVSGTQSGISGTIQITNAVLNVYNYTGTTETTPYLSIPVTNSLAAKTLSFVSGASSFYGSQYIGNLMVPVTLRSFYGFVYDFKLYVELEYVGSGTPSYGVYINIPAYDTMGVGCTITAQSPPVFGGYRAISMTGPTS